MSYIGRKGQTAPLASADLPTNSISTAHLINDAVTSAKIGVDVIVAEDIAANAVTVAEIADDAVTGAKLANDIAITTTGALTGTVSDFNWDSNTLVVDSSESRVGVGTASPAVNLDFGTPGDATLKQLIGLRTNGNSRIGIGTAGSGMSQSYYVPSDVTATEGFVWGTIASSDGTTFAEKMRLTREGNVGISTSVPDNTLHVHKASAGSVTARADAPLVVENNDHCYIQLLSPNSVECGLYMGDVDDNDVGAIGYSHSSNSMYFRTNATNQMSINSAGSLTVGSGAETTEGTAQMTVEGNGFRGYHWLDGTAYYIGQNSAYRDLRMYCGSEAAGVNLDNAQTSWGTYSDERLKFDVENIENATDILSDLRCVKYRLKNVDDEDSKKKIGIVAQDLVGKVDEIIDFTKKPTKEGEEVDETEYMSVRYTELIPILIKSIQELSAKVTALENA